MCVQPESILLLHFGRRQSHRVNGFGEDFDTLTFFDCSFSDIQCRTLEEIVGGLVLTLLIRKFS